MRQINIDLTADKRPLSPGSFIGYIGEHNATELLITIPQAMIDKSDYQILVFQATPLIFRSSKITEDNTKKSYRVGNVIHTTLSKTITQVPSLSLQVECYKEDGCGEPELIGKTQTIPNLILKPSPEGIPVYGYDGSYEELDFAIFNAHKHTNLDVLHRLGVNDAGMLAFDGDALVNLVKHYPTPSMFPETTLVGTLAYAENDDDIPASEDTKIQAHKVYSRIRLRHNIDPKIFDLVYQFAERTSQDMQYNTGAVRYLIACGDDESILGEISIAVAQHIISFMMVSPQAFYVTKALYGKDERLRNIASGFYLYSGTDTSGILDINAPKGWSFFTTKRGNFKYESHSLKSEEISTPYSLVENDTLFSTYQNAGLIRQNGVVDENLENEFLSGIFEFVPETHKHKGLYIFSDYGWIPLEEYFRSNTRIVNTFADLPDDCPAGTIAHVINDGYQLAAFTEKSTIIKNAVYPNIYFAPYPVDDSFIYDFAIHGVYVDNTNPGNRVTYKGSFDVQTNLEEKYILVRVSRGCNSTTLDTFIYSIENQEIIVDDISYPVKKGWNKVIPLSQTDVYIKPITDFSELPFPKRNSEHDSNYGYLITDVEINGVPTNNVENFLLSTNNSFLNIDNGAGLWVKTESAWMKVENANEFLMQEVTIT